MRKLGYFFCFVGLVATCGFAGAVGAFVTRRVGGPSEAIPYADFITIMLAAVSALITTLAIFLAILGVIGWSTFKGHLNKTMKEYVDEEFGPNGGLGKFYREKSVGDMYAGIDPLSQFAEKE